MGMRKGLSAVTAETMRRDYSKTAETWLFEFFAANAWHSHVVIGSLVRVLFSGPNER